MSSTAAHKLAPRSSLCVFLGYSLEHKGYRCLELESNRILTSRHVIFDESFFSFRRHVYLSHGILRLGLSS
jgi:histone deacetylase 1/2